jgi:transcriptional regulator with XRE-family HTH domain
MSETVKQLVTRDYEQLGAELIRAWRGERSLAAFSRRLGSQGGSMVQNWEAKRRWPTAARALWCAERVGVDVCEALRTFYGRPPAWLGRIPPATPQGVVALLQDWLGATSIQGVAERTGKSRFAVARWLSGKAEPRLPDFLRLIEAGSLRLIDFIAVLADPARIPSITEEWNKLRVARSLAYEAPWSHAVLRALELAEYRKLPGHDDAFIAHTLGVGVSQVRHCLELLAVAGQVSREGAHYDIAGVTQIDTRHDPAANLRLKEWWAEIGMERLREGVDGQFSFNLFSVSRVDLERLRELQIAYFRELRRIVASSTPNECVAVVNLQLFDLGAPRRA